MVELGSALPETAATLVAATFAPIPQAAVSLLIQIKDVEMRVGIMSMVITVARTAPVPIYTTHLMNGIS